MSESANDTEGTGVLIVLGLTIALSVAWAYVVKDQGELITWGALLIAGITGAAAGSQSKGSQTVGLTCAIAAPLGTYLGTLLGISLIAVTPLGGDFSDAWTLLTEHTSEAAKVFKMEAQDRDWVFLFLSAPVGYVATTAMDD
ncbi:MULTISPECIES: hypothetical protein [Streptomyces]|uniref:Uncharacterized protein n=1 Tax=Streptomyces xanthii TaxID=2768069 RepID=A0A7H1BBA1_9ACTN|nr:hypothetical protein [Streptomyces xanthii]QNS06006.1 hypothetical protein IAG42_22095 [Streptomyces xanthii]